MQGLPAEAYNLHVCVSSSVSLEYYVRKKEIIVSCGRQGFGPAPQETV
jgi:hypothetical protein